MFLWRNEDGSIKDRHIDWNENNFFSYYSDNINNKFSLNPFDIVKVKFESNFEGGIDKGLEIVVPAIWAYRFQQNFYNKKLTDLARYLLDVAVITGTLGSGTPTVALIEVGFAGTDMFLVANKDQLVNSFGKDGENLLHGWDILYMAYAGYTGIKQITQAAGRTQLSFSLDEIASGFNKFSQDKRSLITQNLKSFGELLKKLGQQGKIQNWEAAYYKFQDYVRTTQLQTLISNASNLAQQLAIKVQDQVKVVIFSSIFNYHIAKFEIRNGVTFLSDIKWLNPETNAQVIAKLNPTSFERNGINKVGELEIISINGVFGFKEVLANGKSVFESSQNLLNVTWKNNLKGHLSISDAQKLWNNTNKSFKHYLEGDFYLKFDESNGELLFGNHNTKELLGFYEGAVNTSIILEKGGLSNILEKLKIYHGVSGAPSYVTSNLSSGAKVITSPERTATIVGNYTVYGYGVGDMKTLAGDELLGNLKTTQFGAKKGGFNVLNVSDEVIDAHGGRTKFWETFNEPWLKEAIERGDDIWAASNPMQLDLLFKDLSLIPVNSLETPRDLANYLKNLNDPAVLNQLTGFGKETQLLSKNGYIYDSSKKMFLK